MTGAGTTSGYCWRRHDPWRDRNEMPLAPVLHEGPAVMIPGGIATWWRGGLGRRPRSRHDPWRDRNAEFNNATFLTADTRDYPQTAR